MKKTAQAALVLAFTAAVAGGGAYALKDKEFKTPMAAPENAEIMICVDTEAKAVHTLDTGSTAVVRTIFGGKSWEFTDMVTQQKKRITPANVENMTCATMPSPLKQGPKAFGK